MASNIKTVGGPGRGRYRSIVDRAFPGEGNERLGLGSRSWNQS